MWNLNLKFKEEIEKDHSTNTDDELDKAINKFLSKINNNLENFSYNKIIANMHETYSILIKLINKNYKKTTLCKNYQNF